MECLEGKLYRVAIIELYNLPTCPRSSESVRLESRCSILECVPLFAYRVRPFPWQAGRQAGRHVFEQIEVLVPHKKSFPLYVVLLSILFVNRITVKCLGRFL